MPSLHFSTSDCVPSTPLLCPHSCFSVSHICSISNSRIGRLQLLSTSHKRHPLVTCCLKPNEFENRRSRFANPWKEQEKPNQNDFFAERSERQIELKSGRSDADAAAISSDSFDLREETGVEKLKDSDERIRQKEISNKGSKRQLMNRSKMLAKQVISARSALSLGFISQLWVDTNSWLVVVIEVRPSLLSGESERFLLDDVSQVGDVVLVPDESVMENEMKMIGLETLVGYDVVTEGQRNMGKVRGYTFDINTGAIESLELDSFGISIIPSTLVSTYSLFVEDVIEVEPDMVVVHESAASRIQRLTKGLWDTHRMGNSINDTIEDSDIERTNELDHGRKRNRKTTKLRKKWIDALDGLELPMDFL